MSPHMERVVEESKALDAKLAALNAFLGTSVYWGLPASEQDRLVRQSWAMSDYASILHQRIKAAERLEPKS